MKDLYVHIGMAKTGTTSIQKLLASSSTKLSGDKVLYPIAGRPQVDFDSKYGHHNLAWSIIDKKIIDKESLIALRKEIENFDGKTVILSSEVFSKFDSKEVESFLSYFHNFNVHLVIYLRNPLSYLKSSYKQMIKTGKISISFQKYVENIVADRCNYPLIINNWIKFVDSSNLYIRLFDKYRYNNTVIDSFFDILQLDYSHYERSSINRQNISPDDLQILLIQKLNILDNFLNGSKFLHRIRRYILRNGGIYRFISSLISRSTSFDSFYLNNLDYYKDYLNDLNEPLKGQWIRSGDWKYIQC
ncbi:MAG: hypothetical protein GF372_08820 [Candidatus Marinimicrobia bacterium]|nr:hypothetical protein [Candidatus Neomarinimicrobiota bacterium]